MWKVAVLAAMLAAFPAAAVAQEKTAQHAVPAPELRVDINHASIDELLRVPGMTRTWAGRIVRFRPYRAKSDLVEQGVLTGEAYARVKDYVIAHREAR
jgi:DNA uptake protein ComE-like DNA-binding protein